MVESGKFDLWLKSLSFEGTYPYLLEMENGYKLLQVTKKYLQIHNYFNAVTYHIWKGNDWLFSGHDYLGAYNLWKNYVENC